MSGRGGSGGRRGRGDGSGGRGRGEGGGGRGRGDGGGGRGRGGEGEGRGRGGEGGGRGRGGEGGGRGRRGGYGYGRAHSPAPPSSPGVGDFPPIGSLSLSPGNPPTPFPRPQQAPRTQPARPQQAPAAAAASSSSAAPPPRPQAMAQSPSVGFSAPPAAAAASSSSAAQPPSVGSSAPPAAAAASSSSAAQPPSVRFSRRPGYGSLGRKCVVRANHFLVEVAEKDLHHYDVTITPQVPSKKINRKIIAELVRLYSESHMGNKSPAYDGRKSLYTAGPLPFESKEFVVKLVEKDDNAAGSSSTKKDREFKVVIRFASKTDLHHLQEFLRGRQLDAPQETIQALDVVLRATASEKYTVVGRSFFHPNLGVAGELGDGIEYWRGYYQSIRPTQMGLSFNVDVSARPFYEPILVSEFVAKYIKADLSRPLSDQDRIKVKRALRGVRVKLMYGDYAKCHKIVGITTETLKEKSFNQGDREISIVEYYRSKYKKNIRFTNLPALQAGNASKDISLPMELCQIVEGQRYTKKLNERQITNLLRATCERPKIREGNIKQVVKENHYNDDQLVKDEFGIRVKEDLALVNARVLQAPRLKYHDSGKEKGVNPSLGQWNMINKKMVNGGTVDFWTCVNFSTWLNQDLPFQFCWQLIEMCQSKGMDFNPNPIVPITTARPNQIERALHDIHKQSKEILERLRNQEKQAKKYHLQLLLVILPDVRGSYGKIKRICDTELGIVSQCVQPRQAAKLNKQYFENVALKINVKVGGRNTVLVDAIQRKIPLVSDCPTIIFGADVTHPSPGEDSSPSIAAVVASMDWPEITKYRAMVCAQRHREEIIKDLYTTKLDPEKGVVDGGMIREQLRAFRKATGHKPHRIIFFRDGVSEGQFSQVLFHEVDAIRRACASLEVGYLPPVTFVVVQKRHHTRLFPADHNSRDLTDRSGNVLPGTVVDTQICHPIDFDFYLNSHAGIQGTSRPAHYQVLYDENNFSADGLQQLVNDMCYTFARCTRSVSLVPPAYYAHLAAYRARYYIEGEISESGSGTAITEQKDNKAVKALPSIHDNVTDVMFYC